MASLGLSFTCPVKYGTMLKPSRCTLNIFPPTEVPLSSLVETSGSPATASSVGNMSMCETMPFSTVFALILPGQRTKHGTRQPPSQLLSFCPRNGVLAPSGQVSFSGPLSVEYMTMVLSVTPSSSSFASSSPICSSCTTIRSLYGSCPLLPRFFSATCVRKCMAVALYQRKNGLSAFTCFSTQSIAFAVISSSIVSIRFLVNGPVSTTVCPPFPSDTQCSTPRGPNSFLNAGSFG